MLRVYKPESTQSSISLTDRINLIKLNEIYKYLIDIAKNIIAFIRLTNKIGTVLRKIFIKKIWTASFLHRGHRDEGKY